jgi:hypothetical protein
MPEERKPVAGGSSSSLFTHEQWWLLPFPLRMRWWQETDYSEREPSAELVGREGRTGFDRASLMRFAAPAAVPGAGERLEAFSRVARRDNSLACVSKTTKPTSANH